MTKEERQLLLEDLCARLPYGIIVKQDNGFSQRIEKIISIYTDSIGTSVHLDTIRHVGFPIEEIKPYLRSMSSMTEEEKEELRQEHLKDEKLYAECITRSEQGDNSMRGKVIPHFAADWCNKHYFDYRGLIEKGLAIEAPEGMYDKN